MLDKSQTTSDDNRRLERRVENLEARLQRDSKFGAHDYQLWSILFTLGLLILTFIFSGQLHPYMDHLTLPRVSLVNSADSPSTTLVLQQHSPLVFDDVEYPTGIVISIDLSDEGVKRINGDISVNPHEKPSKSWKTDLFYFCSQIVESNSDDSNKSSETLDISLTAENACRQFLEYVPNYGNSTSSISSLSKEIVSVEFPNYEGYSSNENFVNCEINLVPSNRLEIKIPSFILPNSSPQAIADRILIYIDSKYRKDAKIKSIEYGVDILSLNYPILDWVTHDSLVCARILSFVYVVIFSIFMYMLMFNLKTIIRYFYRFHEYRKFVRKWKTIIKWNEYFSDQPEERELARQLKIEDIDEAHFSHNDFLVQNGVPVIKNANDHIEYNIEMAPDSYPFWRLLFRFLRPVQFNLRFRKDTRKLDMMNACNIDTVLLDKLFVKRSAWVTSLWWPVAGVLSVVIFFALFVYFVAISRSFLLSLIHVAVAIGSILMWVVPYYLRKRSERFRAETESQP